MTRDTTQGPEAVRAGGAGGKRRARAIVTAPVEGSGRGLMAALAAEGVEAEWMPAIELRRMAGAAADLAAALERVEAKRGWVILPSPAAVRFFIEATEEVKGGAERRGRLRCAVVGEGSARVARELGLRVEFVPEEATGAALAAGLPGEAGMAALVAGSSGTRAELREGLAARGFDVAAVATYEPVACAEGLARLAAALGGGAEGRVVIVTSPSGVEAIGAAAGAERIARARWLAIGETTFEALRGWKVSMTAAASPEPAVVARAARELAER